MPYLAIGHLHSPRASSICIVEQEETEGKHFQHSAIILLVYWCQQIFIPNSIAFIDTEFLSDTAATASVASTPAIALSQDDSSIQQSQTSSLAEVSHYEPGTSACSVIPCTPVRTGKRKRKSKRVNCEDDNNDNIYIF